MSSITATAPTAGAKAATSTQAASGPRLKRALDFPALVVYGLTFIVPIAPIAVYGSLVQGAHGLLASAFLVGIVAMLFTAFSYAALSRIYPFAGSIYNFVQQGTRSGSLGFVSGWAITLDYLILPSVQVIIGTTFLGSLIPQVPAWVWSVILTAVIGAIAATGVDVLSKLSKALLVLQIVIIAWFVVATFAAVARGQLSFNVAAFYNADFSFSNVLSATGLVVVCFLGFDAISTLSEETLKPRRDVPRAIVTSVVAIGLIFILLTWLAGVVQPDWTQINPDSGFLDILGIVGGAPLQIAASIACVLAFPLGCGQECITAVSRILYAMGRDHTIPSVFGRLNRRTNTPVFAIGVVTVITLAISLVTTLDVIGNVVSYGALLGFVLINLTVIWRLFIKNGVSGEAKAAAGNGDVAASVPAEAGSQTPVIESVASGETGAKGRGIGVGGSAGIPADDSVASTAENPSAATVDAATARKDSSAAQVAAEEDAAIEPRSPKTFVLYVIFPLIGIAVDVWIFSGLGALSWTIGTVWLIIGVAILAWKTKLFRTPLKAADLSAYFA